MTGRVESVYLLFCNIVDFTVLSAFVADRGKLDLIPVREGWDFPDNNKGLAPDHGEMNCHTWSKAFALRALLQAHMQ